MTGKEQPKGWGLSSEQYDEDEVLEVDTRSVDYDELRKQAKDPHATWSEGPGGGKDPQPAADHEDDDESRSDPENG